MPVSKMLPPTTHYRRSQRFTAPALRGNETNPLDRAWLEGHDEALAAFDAWTDARDRLDELETTVGQITKKIADAGEDYRLARKAALLAGADPEQVTDPCPALEAELEAGKSDVRLMSGGVQELATKFAQALHAAAPAIVEAAQAADTAALDKVAKAATAANKADDEHREAASVVAMLTNLQVSGGMLANAGRMKGKVPSVAITVGAVDAARDYSASLIADRDTVMEWQAAKA